jgi:actin-related protein
MNINLNIANDPILDAWKGGRDFFNNNIKNDKVYISKKDYEEFGFDYYKENICGNKKYDN